MIRFSLFAMVALTVLIAMGLRWREQRLAATAPRLGVAGRAKRTVNRWATAAARGDPSLHRLRFCERAQ